MIINRGRIVADGPVDTLVSQASAGVRISVEAAGARVEERLAEMDGVRGVERRDALDGRVKVSVMTMGDDVRPRIFELAKTEGWVLYEFHQEAGSLEDLFRQLTAEAAP